jgi:hypothetical protein
MTEPIEDDMVFVPTEGLEISEVPDGRVIYQAAKERVHYFNPTAVVVFELCGMNHSVGEIGAFLRDAYGLAAVPAAEVRECIASLLKEDLLRPATPSSAAH